MADRSRSWNTPQRRTAICSRALSHQRALVGAIDHLLDQPWVARLGLVHGLVVLRLCHLRHSRLLLDYRPEATPQRSASRPIPLPIIPPSTALRRLFAAESRLQRRLVRDSHRLDDAGRRLVREVLIPEIGAASAVLLDDIYAASAAA